MDMTKNNTSGPSSDLVFSVGSAPIELARRATNGRRHDDTMTLLLTSDPQIEKKLLVWPKYIEKKKKKKKTGELMDP
ncbi:hypothetical protein L3Y34_018470 [Caenorhabditis briggsae]|uniref:Uncharacterized protein n=1 Tax=Caenorhabditis briggsae TaxID=6238 RepID=A0AAE9DKS4_CAEBR|nr:hypothetical protein L3Y34_018470 [Caenorhabditis briggsae]